MKKRLHFFKGYLCLSIEGEQIERFLNLCKCQKIVLHRIIWAGEKKIHAGMFYKDFFRLAPIHRKTGVHIHIIKKTGAPFFFLRNRNRKGFFTGMVFCMLLLFFLSGRVWNIHIEGNIRYTTPEILEFMEKNGVVHGMAKRKVNCHELTAMIRKKYPEITWVSAKLLGTRLLLNIQEGKKKIESLQKAKPCDLLSETDGIIIKMVTRSGSPLVKPGEECKAGVPLVSGKIAILNDAQEVIRYEYVEADADIYIQHPVSYYYEFPLTYENKVFQGKEKKSYGIRVGKLYFSTYRRDKKDWESVIETYPVHITENFYLPVDLFRITSKKYKKAKAVYTEEQAKAIAWNNLQAFEEKLMEKGVQISENNVKIEINHTACISRGELMVIEKTGKKVPVQQDEPQERTATDGEQRY